jgi:hypothetical protein
MANNSIFSGFIIDNPTGHGIKPNIEINYGFNDLLERKDLELAKALELLQN